MKKLLPFLALGLVACVPEFDKPLVPLENAKIDRCIVGYWSGKNDEGEDIQLSVTRLKNEKRYLVTGDNGDDGKEAFPVHLSKDGKQRYINVGEDGDWYIIQYKADKVQLSFSVANTAAVAADISAGLIEGEVSKGLFGDQVRVTDTPKKVAKWLKKNGDELFKARMSMTRMGAVPKGCK